MYNMKILLIITIPGEGQRLCTYGETAGSLSFFLKLAGCNPSLNIGCC